MTPSIYINLEDDVSQISARLKRERSAEVILVCPKRCFLFNDSINLRLLKTQTDLLKKTVYILTMDERGQIYAKDAGFELRFLPKSGMSQNVSDIKPKFSKTAFTPQDHVAVAGAFEQSVKSPVYNKTHLDLLQESDVQAEPVLKSKLYYSDLNPVPNVVVKDNIFPEIEIQKLGHPHVQTKKGKVLTSLLFLFASVVLSLTLFFYVLPKASLTVYLKTEPLVRDMEVSLSKNFQTPDSSKLVLPATTVSQTLKASAKFQSQGRKEVGNKSSGKVVIYNFTSQPIKLKAETTILSVGNKNYGFVSDLVFISPTKYKNSSTKEVDESSLSEPVEIQAIEGGESSALPAGARLEISNKAFGSNPKVLFAKTQTPITGGTTRFLSIVSTQDLEDAKQSLIDKLVLDLKKDISAQKLEVPKNALKIENVNFTSDLPVGSQSPAFNAELKATVTGFAYNTEQLNRLVYERIIQTLNKNYSLDFNPNSQIFVSLKGNVDFSNDLAILLVRYEGRLIAKVNLENLPKELTGKKPEYIQTDILPKYAEVENIEVILAPSWQKNFPHFSSKIHVEKIEKK